ncbi:MAG: cysteine desulfurase family protein [Sagittula sp.]|uniref:cysteine desulfurase family protein n=1 Tax=Sagittula sp. TaxID=2038081 RepID=UPI004059FA9D
MSRRRPIYLDYQATTPLDPEVSAAMLPFLEDRFGNPHSEHQIGWEAAGAVDEARRGVADLIGAAPGEIILTAGATEANNLSVMGVARRTKRRHILVSAIEHKCVLAPAAALSKQGFELQTIPVDADGIIDLERLAQLIRPDTALVSVMAANNEIGTLQPLKEISALCSEMGALFHSDAAQLAGKKPLDVLALGIDLLSLSAHKFYGPKGVGALYIAGNVRSQLAPIMYGGGQQDGMRPGTLAPMLCAGLAAAAEKALVQHDRDEQHTIALRARLLSRLRDRIPSIRINGSEESGLSGCLNIRIPGIDAHALLMMLQAELAASVGSACNAGLIEPSYVLGAIGLTPDEARASLRLGFGRFTTLDEIDQAVELICEKASRLSHSVAAE